MHFGSDLMRAYEKLGMITRINAAAFGTSGGGSIMFPEVLSAMQEASKSYISIPELLQKAGDRIAQFVVYNNHDVKVIEGDIEHSFRGENGFGSSGK